MSMTLGWQNQGLDVGPYPDMCLLLRVVPLALSVLVGLACWSLPSQTRVYDGVWRFPFSAYGTPSRVLEAVLGRPHLQCRSESAVKA